MNVLQKIAETTVAAIIATALAIHFLPGMNFVKYVIPVIEVGMILTIALTIIAFYREDSLNLHDKNMLMNGFILVVLIPSFYAAGAFMHQSQTSWSGGEIHWHADFEVLVEEQGELQRLDLIDPSEYCKNSPHEAEYMCALDDRTGSTEYHEHNDNRIHLEGVFKERSDATLAAFFQQFNGRLTNTELVYPTNNGTVERVEGGEMQLKILVNQGVAGNREWCAIETREKISEDNICENNRGGLAETPSNYVISPYKRGPGLDDIFVVYDSKTTEEALQDLREDDQYEGIGLTKSGEGF